MRTHIAAPVLALAVAGALATPATGAVPHADRAAAPRYTVTIIGVQGGHTIRFIGGCDIDNSGRDVGAMTVDPDGVRPFRYEGGQVRNLGALIGPGINEAGALGTNDRGAVVGNSQVTGPGNMGQHAFVWRSGTMTDLGTGYANVESGSWARDINDNGVVIGGHYPRQDAAYRAVTWRSGVLRELPGLGGTSEHGDLTTAEAINDNGTIVGMALDSGGLPRAVRWSGGQVTALPRLSTTRSEGSSAMAINDNGVIAGSAPHASGRVGPVVWKNGRIAALPNVPTSYGGSAEPVGINASEYLVGTQIMDAYARTAAVVWTPDRRAYDLNTLVSGLPAGTTLSAAMAINDNGVIVARLRSDTSPRSVAILTPVR